jgi:uncharacterized protein YceK
MKLIAILIAAFLAGCASTAPAPKPQDGSRTVTVSAEMVARCRAEGGCTLLTKADLVAVIEAAQEATVAGLDSNGCRKGSL